MNTHRRHFFFKLLFCYLVGNSKQVKGHCLKSSMFKKSTIVYLKMKSLFQKVNTRLDFLVFKKATQLKYVCTYVSLNT